MMNWVKLNSLQKRFWLALICLFVTNIIALKVSGQSNTFLDDKKALPGLPAERPNFQVMVIPFEPKLYISEIDQRINAETQMSFEEIRADFRNALDLLLVAELKKRFKVMSLLRDTAQTHADIRMVYESIGYDFVPLPEGGTDAAKKNNTIEARKFTDKNNSEKDKKKTAGTIQDGQLVVTTNDQKRYMNTKVLNPKLLGDLHRKYGINYFVFINELDLKYEMENRSKAMAGGTADRKATIHYSIIDYTGKLIAGGVAAKDFSGAMNEPKKIKATCFIPIVQYIAGQISNEGAPTVAPKQKSK